MSERGTLRESFRNGLWRQNPGLAQVLGLCPILAVSTNMVNATMLGLATVAAMILSNLVISGLRRQIAHKIRIPVFVLIIAALVTVLELAFNAYFHSLYLLLGVFVPLIATNCTVLGSAQLKIADYSAAIAAGRMTFAEAFLENTLLGFFGGVGFALALFLMAGIRERLELAPVPRALRGLPVAFVAAACMALAFFGFAGMG